MELYVFDQSFKFHGVIDEYKQLTIEKHYSKKSVLTLSIAGTKENIALLDKGRVIAKKDDLSHAFIIETREVLDDKESTLQVIAFSLHHLLKKRIVWGQQEFTGTIESVMKSFVRLNAIEPVNPNRIIPNLILNTDNEITGATTEGCSYKQLDDYLFEIANKHEVSWDILFDYSNQKYVFDVWKGADRSTQQTNNPHVIFSQEFDNVLKQHYFESDSEVKTTALVAGEGEGTGRTLITVNDELTGLEREELYVDARDLQSTYRNSNEQDVTLTPAQYSSLLSERGKSKLAENKRIQTFESDVDLHSSFIYGQDYFMGDIVSIKNLKLNVILHTRIMSVIEVFSSSGKTLSVNFGSNIPTLLDKIKKAVK